MPVRVRIDRRVEIAPGVLKFELTVRKGGTGTSKPKIDKAFAKEFTDRLKREARTVMPQSEVQPAK